MLRLFTWFGSVGALGVTLLMVGASASVIVFFARRGSAGAQAWRLVTSAVAGLALLVIVGYTVKDFDVLVGSGPDSVLAWLLPSIIGVALVVGLVQGLLMRSRRPQAHARIGLRQRGVPAGQGGGVGELTRTRATTRFMRSG